MPVESAMPTPLKNEDNTSRRGTELYENKIRPLVETDANIGKFCSIDVKTGDYEIDADMLQAADRLRARRPDAEMWGERIGYEALVAIGGTLTRTTP